MTRLIVLLLVQVAGTAWLVDLAVPEVRAALADPPALADATAAALARLLLFAVTPLASAWMLLVTVADVVVAIRDGGGRRVAPAWIRRVVDQALGTVVLVGVMAGPAAAATPADMPLALSEVSPDFSDPRPRSLADLSSQAPAGDGPDTAASLGPATPVRLPVPWSLPVPSLEVPVPPLDVPVSPPDGQALPMDDPASTAMPVHPEAVPAEPGGPDPGDEDDPGTHVVAPGENLWVIARAQLLRDGLPAPRDVEVHAYWSRLVQDNLPTLRSGDPDVIHPGERLRLPDAVTQPPADTGDGRP